MKTADSPARSRQTDRATGTQSKAGPQGAAVEAPHYGLDFVDCGIVATNPVQRKKNDSGLPDDLKSGIESISGISLDHVRVHYNSSQPALLGALAYAQGSDIHVAPEQEQHLPHEAWHVVQQAQGRVEPTMQLGNGVAINDAPGLEREADVMGERALHTRGIGPVAQRRGNRIVQRKVALSDTLTEGNLKKMRVSDGGSLGVVIIPEVVAKYEMDPQAAVDTSKSINAILGSHAGNAWSVGAPAARRAQTAEAIAIAGALHLQNAKNAGSVGEPNRVAAMVTRIQTALDHVVIYEQATGQDFIKYLAEGADRNDAARKQSKGGEARKGSALAQLEDPDYAKQLGRIAAVDIFMGHKDRLHGAGNFENWMSDIKSRTLTLVDNEISSDRLDVWPGHKDVQDLTQGSYAQLATTIATELESVLNDAGYGGGKLRGKDRQAWQMIRPSFETNLATGLAEGRSAVMQRGLILRVNLRQTNSPLADRFEERLDYFHQNNV